MLKHNSRIVHRDFFLTIAIPLRGPSNHHNTGALYRYNRLRTGRTKSDLLRSQNLWKLGAENPPAANISGVGSGGKFPSGGTPWCISPEGCKPPIQFHPEESDRYNQYTEKRQTLKEQCIPGNAIPSHSVELVRFCTECNSSPSNGNGGTKNSWRFSPTIDEGDPPEDPSPGELCPSSA